MSIITQTELPPGISEREKFLLDCAVSREGAASFDDYAALLAEWQQRMNLVAPSTLPHIWHRHFADSAQLYKLLPASAVCVVDIGSGAGFPGLVLAIMAQAEGRAIAVHLVESIQKKAQFLRAVALQLKLPVTVHAERAEALRGIAADVITARALAPLEEILPLAKNFARLETILLLLKGARAEEELTSAKQSWHFKHAIIPSRSDPSGKVLRIEKLQAHQRPVNHSGKRRFDGIKRQTKGDAS
ncbi:MAG: 16S rRNA (guanine(527)-N(7))-methyltransferase RsmG [Alphaproteobacteria bacterium]|nr:16S rRNA (guanine(527)-N(7))-methyltransferase RsmG [Alphaproteobacteria bacterium]